MADGDEKVRLSVSRAPNCLQASVAHEEGEWRHWVWLSGAQLGPREVRDRGAASSKVKGNPGRAHGPPTPSQEERSFPWPPGLTVMQERLGEGLDQRWVWGWGRNQALGLEGESKG